MFTEFFVSNVQLTKNLKITFLLFKLSDLKVTGKTFFVQLIDKRELNSSSLIKNTFTFEKVLKKEAENKLKIL